MTCGYNGFFIPTELKGWRRFSNVFGNVAPFITKNVTSGFCLDSYYFSVDSSENKTGAYYIGQGLTKIFAQKVLSAPIVIHASACDWTRPQNYSSSKRPLLEKGRKEADLFGFGALNEVHVLESKGRTVRNGSGSLSTSQFNAAMEQALAQVSSVATVNGQTPETRNACVWTLCTSGVQGHVEDPDGFGFDVSVSQSEVIEDAYAFVLDEEDDGFRNDVLSGYRTKEIVPGIHVGLLSDLKKYLKSGGRSVETILQITRESRENSFDSDVYSAEDGTIIYMENDIYEHSGYSHK